MASSLKKQMLSQIKSSGAASYDSFCNKDWEQKYSISPGKAGKEFRSNTCLCNVSCLRKGSQTLSGIMMVQITSSAKYHSKIQGR